MRWRTPMRPPGRSPTCWHRAARRSRRWCTRWTEPPDSLTPTSDYVDNLLNTLPDAYQMVGRLGLYGDFFSFYLCDALLEGQRQGRSTGVRQAGRPGHRAVHAEMKTFSERNPLKVGAIGIGVTLAAMWLSLNYQKLPFIDQTKEYSAYFAEAGGLAAGNSGSGFGLPRR